MNAAPLDFASLKRGTRFAGIVYAIRIERRITSTNKPYLDLQLRDRKRYVLTGRKWDIARDEVYACPGLLYVEGEVGEYRGTTQLTVRRCEERDGDDSEFIPRPYRSRSELEADLWILLQSISDPTLSAIFIGWPEFVEQLAGSPASMRYHGGYPGGLLEHTVNVARVCMQTAEHYGDIVDRDLLLTGALLHDVGKIGAYDASGSSGRSDGELFLGHVVQGILRVQELTDGIPGLDAPRRRALLHLIASHHGQKDWGAPTEPATVEAYILHYADQIDASVTGLRDAVREALPGERWVFFHMRKNHVLRPERRASDRPDRRPEHYENDFIDVPF